MIKSELVQRIAGQNPHLYQRDIEKIVNSILGKIVIALARGDRVEMRGFGVFSVKQRPARVGRNPRTGKQVAIDHKAVPFFKAGTSRRRNGRGNVPYQVGGRGLYLGSARPNGYRITGRSSP